jgi:hypothetical protein
MYLGSSLKKTLKINNKDENPSIKSTRQMKTQANTIQRKNKSKQSTKSGKNHMQRGLIVTK